MSDDGSLNINIRTTADNKAIEGTIAATGKLTAENEKLANAAIRAAEAQQAADLLTLSGKKKLVDTELAESDAIIANQIKRAEQQKLIYAAGEVLRRQASVVQANKATLDFFDPNAGKKIDEVSKAAGTAQSALRGTSGLLSRLGSQLGFLGGIGRSMGNGFAASGFVILSILVKITNGIKEVSAALETTTVQPLVDLMEKLREKTAEVEKETRNYYERLKQIAQRPETEEERASRERQIIQEKAKFEETMAERLHEIAVQRIDAEESTNVISHADALLKKFHLEEDYQKKILALKNKAAQDELDNKTAELGRARDRERIVAANEDIASKKLPGLAANEEREKLKLEQEKKNREANRELIKKSNDELNEVEEDIKANNQGAALLPGGDPNNPAQLGSAASIHYNPLLEAKRATLKATMAGAYSDLDANDRAIPKQTKVAEDAAEAHRKAAEKLKEDRTELEQIAATIHKLVIELPSLATQTQTHIQHNTQLAAANSQLNAAKTIVQGGRGPDLDHALNPPHAPAPRFYTPPRTAAHSAPEMSPEEIQARGGNNADLTRTQRAHDAADANAREIVRKSADVAEGLQKMTEIIMTGHGDLAKQIRKNAQDIRDLTSKLKGTYN